MFKWKIFFLIFSLSFLMFNFKPVFSAGLVPCGGYEENGTKEDVCTICHLFLGIKGLIDWIRNIAVFVGLFVITLAGVMWIVSSGGELANMAKSAIKNTLIGIVVMLTGWLLIFSILASISAKSGENSPNQLVKNGTWSFTCSTKSFIGGEGDGNPNNPPNDPDDPEIPEDPGEGFATVAKINRELFQKFKENGIGVVSTGGNAIMCRGEKQSAVGGCITLYGLKDNTVEKIIALKKKCPNCNITLTSGTDKIVSSTGKTFCNEIHAGCDTGSQTSHNSGSKVDLDSDLNLRKFIEKNPNIFKPIGSNRYLDGNDIYFDEGNHWDVCVGCN